MVITPNTEVRLLSNVPLTHNQAHQMTFDTKELQTSFFLGKSTHTATNCTYQREEQAIRFPESRDTLYNCNYIMYRNTDFSTKWFYAFITRMEYVNPNMTLVHFEVDVFQTWQFDFSLKPSFVEREHCKRWNADGTPVLNTVDEGLNYGTEYATKQITQYIPYDDVFFLIIVCKKRMDTNGNAEITPILNGSPQPLTYYIHPFKMDGTTPTCYWDGTSYTALSPLTEVLKALYKGTDAVNNIVSLYVTEYPGFQLNYGGNTLMFTSDKTEPVTIQDSISINTFYLKSLPGYEVRTSDLGDKYTGFDTVTESKLWMHPYALTVVTDMKGNQVEIKNEYVLQTNLQIDVRGSLGTSNKVSYNIHNYLVGDIPNSGETALGHAVINSNPQDVPIITDLLSAYIQGNKNSIQNTAHQMLFNSVFGAIGNVMTRSIPGAIQEGGNNYFAVQGMLAKQKDLNNTPPSISNLGGNTHFDYGNDVKGVYVIKKQITQEYQKKLTDYFKMFGYKVNEVKTPILKTREHFNYIKTVGAVVFGDVPREDLDRIEEMFDKGVTLWHGDWVCDYSLPNGEL